MDFSDLVVLYSDGITEAGIESGPEFGDTRLEQMVKDRVGELIAGIARAAARIWTT